MYTIALDLKGNPDANPRFECKDLDELIKIITFFFENGYDVWVKSDGN